MSLEAYTGKIKDLVITNPTPTDPKSQGDDHLRGIKKTMVDDAVRVSGSPLQQMGDKATAGENHFWDARTANQLSLNRGTPDAPGTTVMQVVNGAPSLVANSPVVTISGNVLAENGAPAAGSDWVARYVRNGGVITAEVSIYVEGAGTASGGLILQGFPKAKVGSNYIAVGVGRHGATGTMLQGIILQNSQQLSIFTYQNTMIWTQSLMNLSISYLGE